MVIGILTLELSIPAAHSLKEKRQVIKSVQARLRREFNISIAEIDRHDNRQIAVLGVACVSADEKYAHGLLMRVVEWVENTRLDCILTDFQIEMVH